jgi:two-component system NarL family response regulator
MGDVEAPINVNKILVVDDHYLFREGVISIFRATSDFQVVGSAGSVTEAIEKVRGLRPDIVLMDFSLPDGTGLEATKRILAESPDTKIVFLTVYETDENLFSAIRMGARGYMLKNVPPADLLASLRALERGEMATSRKMMSRVMEEFSRSATSSTPGKESVLAKLSPREVEVLAELQTGATNFEIAQRLFLSENTVKHHIRSVLEKLGVENRREAAQIAQRLGLTSKPSDLDSI